MLAVRLYRSSAGNRQAAQRLFVFSILYLFVLFAALLVDNVGNRWSSTLPGRAAATPAASLRAEMTSRPVGSARRSTSLRAEEI